MWVPSCSSCACSTWQWGQKTRSHKPRSWASSKHFLRRSAMLSRRRRRHPGCRMTLTLNATRRRSAGTRQCRWPRGVMVSQLIIQRSSSLMAMQHPCRHRSSSSSKLVVLRLQALAPWRWLPSRDWTRDDAVSELKKLIVSVINMRSLIVL